MEKELLARFGTSIRNRRKELGISQEGLALTAALDRTYVGGVERGERNVSLLNIAKLAAALETTPAVLLASLNAPTKD